MAGAVSYSLLKGSLLEFLYRRPALRRFMLIHAIDELNSQILNVAAAWYIYAATHEPMSLAAVGLMRFLPNIALALTAGQAADRFDRRRIIQICFLLRFVCLVAFAALFAGGVLHPGRVYALLLVFGAAQSFSVPAMSAMLPRLVNREEFPRAVAIHSTMFQVCGLAGPAIGGILYAGSGPAAFASCAGLYWAGLVAALRLKGGRDDGGVLEPADSGAFGGIRYIRTNRLLLGTISLDLFAVLLGGVTALLPIYAKDILLVGPAGLGLLRCAPAAGAALVGMVLAHRPVQSTGGRLMLCCVAGFGLATMVFAVSANFWLSLAALVGVGAFDMVSMVIRQSLVQLSTPDAMRGRVSAVQGVFVGASSDLGELESGVAAAVMGAMPAALLGGLGTLAVVAIWSRLFPELARAHSRIIERA